MGTVPYYDSSQMLPVSTEKVVAGAGKAFSFSEDRPIDTWYWSVGYRKLGPYQICDGNHVMETMRQEDCKDKQSHDEHKGRNRISF